MLWWYFMVTLVPYTIVTILPAPLNEVEPRDFVVANEFDFNF